MTIIVVLDGGGSGAPNGEISFRPVIWNIKYKKAN